MRAASTLPVTAKIRLGWDGHSQNVVDVCRALEDAGADAVAIHARTRAEKFEGHAHWEMIGEAKRAVGIPVIGNGDVRTEDDAAAHARDDRLRRRHAGAGGVRGPVGVPRLCARSTSAASALPPPTAAERLEAGIRHLRHDGDDVGPGCRGARDAQARRLVRQGLPHSARRASR